jgi:hypothetical protein
MDTYFLPDSKMNLFLLRIVSEISLPLEMNRQIIPRRALNGPLFCSSVALSPGRLTCGPTVQTQFKRWAKTPPRAHVWFNAPARVEMFYSLVF